jgi:hypothetical protein
MAAAGLVAAGYNLSPQGTLEKAMAEKTAAEKEKEMQEKCKRLEDRVTNLMKMSGAHSAYMNHEDATMPEGGKEAFADMSADERDAHMKKHPLEAKAKKRYEALPEDVRKRLEKADADAAVVADLKKSADMTKMEKRAVEIGLATTDAELLYKAHNGDLESVVKLEDKILALTNQVKEAGLFKELGSKNGSTVTAKAEIEKRVDELRKADKDLTQAQAMDKIAGGSPEDRALFKRYRDETEGRAAA